MIKKLIKYNLFGGPLLLVVLTVLLLSSCSNTAYLVDQEALHHKSNIELDSKVPIDNPTVLKEELYRVSRPKPNRKWFGFLKVNLWFYNTGDAEGNSFQRWMNQKVGEPPVLLDTTLLESSSRLMETYLFNHGYFHSEVDFETKIKNKRATVNYLVNISDSYTIDSVIYPPADSSFILQKIRGLIPESRLIKGAAFNVDNLESERLRITNDLRENGFFEFDKKYIRFAIDSSAQTKSLDIYLTIDEPADSLGHQQFYINDIYINAEYYAESELVDLYDTLLVDGYYFINQNGRFKPKNIIEQVKIRKDQQYTLTSYRNTFENLLKLGVFKFVNIRFEKVDSLGKNKLDTYIYLTPNKKMQYSLEFEGNNRFSQNIFGEGALGTAISANFQNKNVFRGAERFSANLFGGVEFNIGREEDEPLINTINVNGKLDLSFPKLILPFPIKWLRDDWKDNVRSAKIKSRLSLSDNFIRNVNVFSINGTELSFGYDWQRTKQKRYLITPASFSYSFVYNTEAIFDDLIANDVRVRRSFEDRLIIGGNYSYFYTSKKSRNELRGHQVERYYTFRGDFELAGNVMWLVEKSLVGLGAVEQSVSELFDGLDFSQFVRLQADYKYFFNFEKSTLVARAYGGIGLPYGRENSVLPYIRQFFSGGSNGVRAFRIRNIGPGSYIPEQSDVNNLDFDRTGDIKLEANLEYRFPLYWYMKGALFLDAGNVWTLKNDSTKVGGQFKANRFLNDFGLGTGFGIRFDFTYFILRFDLAMPLYVPFRPEGDRWVIRDFNLSDRRWRRDNLVLQLGIGYPF